MPLPPALADFFREVGPLGEDDPHRGGTPGRVPRCVDFNCGGNDIFVPRLADLWKAQDAFAWDFRRDEPIEGWPPNWLAIATEGSDAYVYDSDADAMRFVFAGAEVEDAYDIAGTPGDVIGALALYAIRLEEAGDSAMNEDFEIDPTWVATVRTELQAAFGDTADGVLMVLTEV